jgi:hypothetical protein
MQNLSVYLYQNNLVLTLDLDPTVRGVNPIMYQRDLKIQKGIKNQIRIQFQNSDQKKITVSNTDTYVFTMFDAINRRQILDKELEILDQGTTATRGLALLTLNESDTIDLTRTDYQFSIRKLETDGTYTPTYSNTYYGINGTLHLLQDIYPVLRDSVKIESFNKFYVDDQMRYEHYSGIISADPEFNSNSALHTAVFYMTDYRGSVKIQATMDNSPTINSNWATIETRTYDQFTGIDYVNFNGVYSFVRFIHVPGQGPVDPDNDNPDYYGNFDKILYRS